MGNAPNFVSRFRGIEAPVEVHHPACSNAKCHVTPAIFSRDFVARHPNRWKPCLFVARCVKVARWDYEVARCDFVARQSRASKSRENRRCDMALTLTIISLL